MYTRTLVPPDGLALAEAVLIPGFPCSLSEPSIVSSLIDRLEAEIQTYSHAIRTGCSVRAFRPSPC